MNSHYSEVIKAVFRGVLVVALFWLTGFALVQFGQRVFGGWVASQVGQVVACGIGIFLASRLRVRFVGYVLAGQLAFSLSELVLHSVYGNRSVQGGPTHLAVMLAGTLGVVLGWFLRSRGSTQEVQLEPVVTTSSRHSATDVTAGELASGAA